MSEIRTRLQGGTPFFPNMLNNGNVEVCLKEDVDKALSEKDTEIAELKKKLMPCLNGDCILTCEVVEKYGKENADLKAKLEDVQASAYAENVDANMENRRLKRALYKACAEWALSTIAWLDCIDQGNPIKWGEMRRKCLEKVEGYR